MKAFKRIQPKTSDDIKSVKDCMIRSVTLAWKIEKKIILK